MNGVQVRSDLGMEGISKNSNFFVRARSYRGKSAFLEVPWSLLVFLGKANDELYVW